MIRRSRWSVFLTLLFAAGQLAMPAVLTIGDAYASNDGRAIVGHVEGRSGAGCRAAHPDDCAVCRYLTALAAPSSSKAAQFSMVRQVAHPAIASRSAPSRDRHGFLSRAPPALSA